MKRKMKVLVALTLITCLIIGNTASAASSRSSTYKNKTVTATITVGTNGSYALARIDYFSTTTIYLRAQATAYYLDSKGQSFQRTVNNASNNTKGVGAEYIPPLGGSIYKSKSLFQYGAGSNFDYYTWDDLVYTR